MDSLELILDRLNGGDDDAARQVFVAYEPYLRKVVRRLLPSQLRAKFDSIDVVQSVWGDLLTRFRDCGMRFDSAAQLRAFLLRATRHRFIDRVRQHRTASRLERPFDAADPRDEPTDPLPRASQLAEADELWERLLSLCPAEHHPVLQLRRDGYKLDEIAQQTGLHEGSVRRILRTLALRLACDSNVPEKAEIP